MRWTFHCSKCGGRWLTETPKCPHCLVLTLKTLER